MSARWMTTPSRLLTPMPRRRFDGLRAPLLQIPHVEARSRRRPAGVMRLTNEPARLTSTACTAGTRVGAKAIRLMLAPR